MSRSASRSSTPAEGTISQEIKFTPPPPPEVRELEEPLSFWEQLSEVPDDQWSRDGEKGYKVYLYEGTGGRYIDLITQPFDIEWVKQKFGGGSYRAQLNNPGGKIAASVRFTIDGEGRGKPPQSAHNSTAPAQATDSFQSQVLEIIRESQRRQEQFFERFLDSHRNPVAAIAPAQVDPTVLFRSMVDMFKEMLPQSKPMDLLETFALVEKLRGPDLLSVLKSAKEAGLIPAAAGQSDLVTQIKSITEVAESIGLTAGGKGKSLGEAVIEKLPDILEAGGKAMEKYQAIENTRLQTARTIRDVQAQQRGAVVTPAPGVPHQVEQHAGVAAHAPTAGVGLEVETPGGTPQGQAVAEMTEAEINTVKQQVVHAIGRGMSGADIFGYLNTTAPAFLNGFLLRNAGGEVTGVVSESQLAMYCSNDPILRQATTLARFKPCIRELLQEIEAYLGIGDEEEEAPNVPVQ